MVDLIDLGYCIALIFLGLGIFFYLLGKGIEKANIKIDKEEEED